MTTFQVLRIIPGLMRKHAMIAVFVSCSQVICAATANPPVAPCSPPCCNGPIAGSAQLLCEEGEFTCATSCRQMCHCNYLHGNNGPDVWIIPCRVNHYKLMSGCRYDAGKNKNLGSKCFVVSVECNCTGYTACDDPNCSTNRSELNVRECTCTTSCDAKGWR